MSNDDIIHLGFGNRRRNKNLMTYPKRHTKKARVSRAQPMPPLFLFAAFIKDIGPRVDRDLGPISFVLPQRAYKRDLERGCLLFRNFTRTVVREQEALSPSFTVRALLRDMTHADTRNAQDTDDTTYDTATIEVTPSTLPTDIRRFLASLRRQGMHTLVDVDVLYRGGAPREELLPTSHSRFSSTDAPTIHPQTLTQYISMLFEAYPSSAPATRRAWSEIGIPNPEYEPDLTSVTNHHLFYEEVLEAVEYDPILLRYAAPLVEFLCIAGSFVLFFREVSVPPFDTQFITLNSSLSMEQRGRIFRGAFLQFMLMNMRSILLHPLDVVLSVFETHHTDFHIQGRSGVQRMITELNHFMEKFAFVTETENPGSGGWQLFFWKTIKAVNIVATGQGNRVRIVGGGFPLLNHSEHDLSRMQLYNKALSSNNYEPCHIFAVRRSGVLNEQEMTQFSLRLPMNVATASSIAKVLNELGVAFSATIPYPGDTTHFRRRVSLPRGGERTVALGLFYHHWVYMEHPYRTLSFR